MPQRTREWREKNISKWRKQRNRAKYRRQRETKHSAVNGHQPWTARELKYLGEEGLKRTIAEMAIKLGRSYRAVQMAAHNHGISLFSPEKASGLCNR